MTTPYYSDDVVTLHHGDCLDVLRTLGDESIDAVCTDPPYALEFMGRGWDKFTPLEFELWVSQWAAECLRVLKPGGHMLAFGGSRTWHRLAAGIEDAGFEIRDSIAWLYGSGFPKSLDVSKAIDRAAGEVREVIGEYVAPDGKGRGELSSFGVGGMYRWGDTWHRFEDLPRHAQEYVRGGNRNADGMTRAVTAPATDAARAWEGWGTALKPAFEPVVVARKPLTGTVAGNVLAYGTGALNIDGCRIETDEDRRRNARGGENGLNGEGTFKIRERRAEDMPETSGRWPANVVLDESQAAELDRQSGTLKSPATYTRNAPAVSGGVIYGAGISKAAAGDTAVNYGDSGGASRFFPTFRYEAKAPTSERPKAGEVQHPTVKPLDLMRWLVRLVTPPGGVVLEPFAGSGTTVEAAVLEGFSCIAIEREAEYLPLIEQRLSKPLQQSLFDESEVA